MKQRKKNLLVNSIAISIEDVRHLNESKYSKWTKQNFLKAVFHNFYLVDSWILCPKYVLKKSNGKFLISRNIPYLANYVILSKLEYNKIMGRTLLD